MYKWPCGALDAAGSGTIAISFWSEGRGRFGNTRDEGGVAVGAVGAAKANAVDAVEAGAVDVAVGAGAVGVAVGAGEGAPSTSMTPRESGAYG